MGERPVRIVTAGVDAEGMAKLANEAGGTRVQAAATGDMQGARLVKKGVVDYYFGTCWSGGGGALAAATAMLGAERVGIVATPGIAVDPALVVDYLEQGRTAFGFPYEQSRSAISTLVAAILERGGPPERGRPAERAPGEPGSRRLGVAPDSRGDAGGSPFAERFDVLEGAGQLDPHVRPLVETFLDDIGHEFSVQVDESTASQFATHVAVAFTRIFRRENDLAPSDVVAEEITTRGREHDFVTAAIRAREDGLQRVVPQAEIDYMTVHVCALVDGQKVTS